MGIEQLVEILEKLKFKRCGSNKSLTFSRDNLTISLSIFNHLKTKYWTFSIIDDDDVLCVDLFSHTIDVEKILFHISKVFRDEIRSKKIDLILDSNI